MLAWSLALFMLPSLGYACIPTKVPEPGIPAKPPGPVNPPTGTCTPLAQGSTTACLYQTPQLTCTPPALLSATQALCNAPNTKFVIAGHPTNLMVKKVSKVFCETTNEWTFDGVPQSTIEPGLLLAGATGHINVMCTA